MAEQGLRIRREMPTLLLTHGMAMLEQAKQLTGPEERAELAGRAQADIDRALSFNPTLRRDHARVLDEAKALRARSVSHGEN